MGRGVSETERSGMATQNMKSAMKRVCFEPFFLKAIRIPRVLDMKRTMMMDRTNKKMEEKKAVVNVPTKMNVKKRVSR
jgi:hypothetical protein